LKMFTSLSELLSFSLNEKKVCDLLCQKAITSMNKAWRRSGIILPSVHQRDARDAYLHLTSWV